MREQRLEKKDVVKLIEDAMSGRLDIPEFERKFVWTPEKAKDLVDSLWRGYPIGTITLWESKYSSPRVAHGSQSQKLWVLDGHQRITTLSLLFGKKPYWWPEASEWNKYYEKYDVLVDLSKPRDSLEFGLPNRRRIKSPEWVSVREILTCENLSELAKEISNQLNQDFSEVHEKLQLLKRIENYSLYEIIVDHEPEEAAKIFTRLNKAGEKLSKSDEIHALVAAKQKGWERDNFTPFLNDLKEKGFKIGRSILKTTIGTVGTGIVGLKYIPEDFWGDRSKLEDAWSKTKSSISQVVRQLNNIGILSSEILPSHNLLIPLFVLQSKFGRDFNFKKALRWFLLATWDGRGRHSKELEQDIRTINSSPSFDEAINNLIKSLSTCRPFTKDDFLKDYHDEFLRLILYLVIFKNEAKDWENQDIRIGYDRSKNQLNEGFKPEWHHFFPKSKLKKHNVDKKKRKSLANIVVLNEKANRAFTSNKPEKYIKKHGVDDQRLREQFVPVDESLWKIENYDKFLDARASYLADAANKFMNELMD